MAPNDTTVAPPAGRLPAYDGQLMAAFLRGATTDQAAAAAGVSRRTALRWKARHGARLDDARRHLLDAAQAQLRDALPATAELVARGAREVGAVVPAALQRLAAVLADPDADHALVVRTATVVLAEARAAAALAFEIHGKLAEEHDIEGRLAALEASLSALAAAPAAPWTSFLGARRPPPAELPT